MDASSPSNSTTRLEARVDPEVKAQWQQAADILGCTLTSFVVNSTQEAASKVIAQHCLLMLGRQDSEAFVDAVLNPSEPSEGLKAAALRYKHLVQT